MNDGLVGRRGLTAEHPAQTGDVLELQPRCIFVQGLAQMKAKSETFETISNGQPGSSDLKNSCVPWKS